MFFIIIWKIKILILKVFFFQAEDGIRDSSVTGVQTCALPIAGSGFLRHFGGAESWHRFFQYGFAAAITASVQSLVAGFFFDVPPKLEAHGGKNFSGEVVFAARGEALEERSSEHRSGRGGFDGGEDG